MVSLPSEHGHRMMENKAPALDTLVHPSRSMFFFVKWYRKCLTSTIVRSVNQSNFKFIRVLCKMMGTGHSFEFVSDVQLDGGVAIPAAPAPTTKTLFFWDAFPWF